MYKGGGVWNSLLYWDYSKQTLMGRFMRDRVKGSKSSSLTHVSGSVAIGTCVYLQNYLFSIYLLSYIFQLLYCCKTILIWQKNQKTNDFLFSYLLVRQMVDPEINFSKDILTYLYSRLLYSMSIFAWLLSPPPHVQCREVPGFFRSCVPGSEGLPETAANRSRQLVTIKTHFLIYSHLSGCRIYHR